MGSDWDRVAADPALLADVRRRYRGTGDVADQLWWLQHPGSAAPSGAQDPELGLEAARRSLYRQDVRAEEALAAVAGASRLLDDRALARLALLDALADRDRAAPEPPVPAGPARGGTIGRSPRLRLSAAGLALAALAVGVLAGRALPSPPPTPAGAALTALQAAQRPVDRLAAEVRPRFVEPGSTRLLARYGSIGTEVYGGRGTRGGVCLIAVVLAQRVAGSCTTDSAFSTSGLFAVIQAGADPTDDSGRMPSDELGVTWRPDGTLRITS